MKNMARQGGGRLRNQLRRGERTTHPGKSLLSGAVETKTHWSELRRGGETETRSQLTVSNFFHEGKQGTQQLLKGMWNHVFLRWVTLSQGPVERGKSMIPKRKETAVGG